MSIYPAFGWTAVLNQPNAYKYNHILRLNTNGLVVGLRIPALLDKCNTHGERDKFWNPTIL